MHTNTATTPAIDKRDPAHNDYAMALVAAIAAAARPEAEGGALVEVPGTDASSSPWLLSTPPDDGLSGWLLSRRLEGGAGWSDVLRFNQSIDAAAAAMRTFDERHPITEPLGQTWQLAQPLALAA